MKNIVIITNKMVRGGIEQALLAMLKNLIENTYKVTLVLLSDGGGLKEAIPSDVKIISIMNEEEKISISKREIFIDLKNFRFISGINKLMILFSVKFLKNPYLLYKYQCRALKKYKIINEEYDFAIAYQAPTSLTIFYTLFNIKAKSKFLWIHGDVTKCPFNIKLFYKLYKKYDYIFCVSKLAKEKLIERLPKLSSKTDVLYNLVDEEEILKKSRETKINLNKDCNISLITVGRISYEKGYDLAIDTCEKLIKNGYNLKWYICGEGDVTEYRKLIEKKGLNQNFIFLGDIKNPYPYIKAADIYVQTSRHEGYCLALHEARVLNKVIVTTDFITAKEQIINDKTGIIVPFNASLLYKAISEIILDEEKREKLKSNLYQQSFHLENEMRKLYKKMI